MGETESVQISEYGRALREWRERHGITREEISVEAGPSAYSVQNIETGQTRVPSRMFRQGLRRMAEARGIELPRGW